MKLGFNEATSRDCSDLPTDLKLCERAGFDSIEIRLDMLRNYMKDHDLDELSDFFAASHLKPHAMNALYLYEKLFAQDDDPAERETAMDDFNLACRAAQHIGSRYLIVVVPLHRKPDVEGPYDAPWPEVFSNCVRILMTLGQMAAPFKVNLCLELVGHEYSAVRTVERAWDIVKAVDMSNVGLCFDACNLYLYHHLQDFSVMELVNPEKIFDVHINDADNSPMQGLMQSNRVFCGEGNIDLMDFLRVLQRLDYQGNVSIETFRPEYWSRSPQWVVDNAYQSTRSMMQKAGIVF